MGWIDLENKCKRIFEESSESFGPFWHLCTPGNLEEVYCTDEDDFKFAVSNIAISAAESDVTVVTDAQMSNHLHTLLGGAKENCQKFLANYVDREKKYFESIDRQVNLGGLVCPEPILITDIDMMRSEIVYINRNGYVPNPQYTPFSYPWSCGRVYFNDALKLVRGIPYNSLAFREKRKLCRKRVEQMPMSYAVLDGMILQESYSFYQLGEKMFHDAHHYMSELSKNVEAYSEISKRLGDKIFMTDDEMYPAVKMLCIQKYNITQPANLPPNAKLEMARKMHYDYNATNSQIQRILKLPANVVTELFPKAR